MVLDTLLGAQIRDQYSRLMQAGKPDQARKLILLHPGHWKNVQELYQSWNRLTNGDREIMERWVPGWTDRIRREEEYLNTVIAEAQESSR